MIKKYGGVFGRNPTFNDVTVEGDLSLEGSLIINGNIITGLDYNGAWDADTNTPDLTALTPQAGAFWIVSVAGTTDLDGFTSWSVGDWAIYDGSSWQRVEGGADGNFVNLTSTGTTTLNGTTIPASKTLLTTDDVDDTPVDGATTDPISSNWAHDHAALTTAHGISTFGATLVDDADAATARSTLGLGTAATTDSTDYATAAQGALADSALQDIVDDTTPQLGGDLDTNNFNINFGDNDKATFGADVDGFMQFNSTDGVLEVATTSANFFINTGRVILDSDITPNVNNAYDIGSSSFRWADGYFAGSLYSGGASFDGAVVINESGADVDFRIESDTNANAFFLEGSSGNVGIDTSSPSSKLHTVGDTYFDGSYTEKVYAVSGTTPALSPTNGTIQTWTLSAASTPTAGTWAAGQSLTLLVDDGTNYTIDWSSMSITWKTDGGTAPFLLTSGETVIVLWKVGSTIYGARIGNA